jgi:hypothetical protein
MCVCVCVCVHVCVCVIFCFSNDRPPPWIWSRPLWIEFSTSQYIPFSVHFNCMQFRKHVFLFFGGGWGARVLLVNLASKIEPMQVILDLNVNWICIYGSVRIMFLQEKAVETTIILQFCSNGELNSHRLFGFASFCRINVCAIHSSLIDHLDHDLAPTVV